MRLRRETGDFQIVLGENGFTARPNLKAEQFVGEIIVVNGNYYVVTSVVPNEGGCDLTVADTTLLIHYDEATGVIAVETE